MAYAASLDYNNCMVSRLSLEHQQQQQQQQPTPAPHHQHQQQQQQQQQHVDDADSLNGSADPAMISPASIDDGGDSYASTSATIFSPQSSAWEDFSAPPLDRTQSLSNGTFFEPAVNEPFQRPEVAGFGQHPSWPLVDGPSDARSAFGRPQAHEAFPPHQYHAGPRTFVPIGSSAPGFGGAPVTGNVRPSSVFPAASAGSDTPLSTSPEKWNPIAGDMEPQALPRRLRHNSPSRPFSPGPFTRRDGIRKKNARFEIPAERNLHTIDQLISEATNEDDIKELKQQKRLLRNRQAALDSRQRKKKHTEELEEEKKQWNERYSMLETELDNLRIERERYATERLHWEQQFYQQQQRIQALQFEKENLVSQHTLETGELRKKVNFLADRLDKAAAAAGPATVTPASTDFADFGLEMNGLGLEGDEFNNYIFVDPQFAGEHDSAQAQQQQQQQQPQTPSNSSMAVSARPKQHATPGSNADKPVASGILFMLLLCGAFVASKASGSRAPPMPRMPDDVRAASATVLDSLLKDAGSSGGNGNGNAAHQAAATSIRQALEPGPSGGPAAWPMQAQHKATLSGAEFASLSQASGLGINGMPPSTLDRLHRGLVAPTPEQEGEQLFSMTPAQYNSLANPDYPHRGPYGNAFTQPTPPMTDDDSGSVPGRKTLAASLQRMRQDATGDSAAEVYTRSLLWERVPSEVVREFKRMVEESNKLTEAEQDTKVEP